MCEIWKRRWQLVKTELLHLHLIRSPIMPQSMQPAVQRAAQKSECEYVQPFFVSKLSPQGARTRIPSRQARYLSNTGRFECCMQFPVDLEFACASSKWTSRDVLDRGHDLHWRLHEGLPAGCWRKLLGPRSRTERESSVCINDKNVATMYFCFSLYFDASRYHHHLRFCLVVNEFSTICLLLFSHY